MNAVFITCDELIEISSVFFSIVLSIPPFVVGHKGLL